MRDWKEEADWKARIFVNGWIRNPRNNNQIEPKSGAWSSVFLSNEMVRMADDEGWARDLRMYLIAEVRKRIMAKQSHSNIDDLMPTDRKWIDYARDQAKRDRLAAEWRSKQLVAKEARAPKDDSRDRKGWMQASEAVTRAAQTGFPDHSDSDMN